MEKFVAGAAQPEQVQRHEQHQQRDFTDRPFERFIHEVVRDCETEREEQCARAATILRKRPVDERYREGRERYEAQQQDARGHHPLYQLVAVVEISFQDRARQVADGGLQRVPLRGEPAPPLVVERAAPRRSFRPVPPRRRGIR